MPKKKSSDKLTTEEQILLKQAQNVLDIIKLPGWTLIASFIQESISWPNPKEYKTKEELILPYSEAYGASELARKIGNYVNSQEQVIKTLTAKVDNEDDLPDFQIGR